jgi:RNA polymerase sigma factor (sigma-70 family)
LIEEPPAQQPKFMLKPTPRVKPPQVQRADRDTLLVLFENEETPLLRYAYSLVGRRAVAEEIVQDIFLQLHINWEHVESPRAWLYRSVRNRAFNHIRDHQRETVNGRSSDTQSLCDESEKPITAMEKLESIETLHEAIDSLQEADRQLVKMKYFDGLKYREISEKTGMSISNVGYRLHHILKDLADTLPPQGIDTNS